jgi:hypothetical protein
MATLNDRNEQQADASLRAERLISLGADRGVARQIAAMELGLIGGDRIELEVREEQRSDLPLSWPDKARSGRPLFIPGEMAEIPSMLTAISSPRDRRVSGQQRSSLPEL